MDARGLVFLVMLTPGCDSDVPAVPGRADAGVGVRGPDDAAKGPEPRPGDAPDAEATGGARNEADAAHAAVDARPAPFDPAPFSPVGEFSLGPDGRTAPIEVAPANDALAFVLRVSAGAETPAYSDICYQLENMITDAGDVWVGPADAPTDWGLYCTDCTHRVAIGRGYALFSFPNDGLPLPDVGQLSFVVSVRECLTRLPADVVAGTELELELPSAVHVDILGHTPPPLDSVGRLRVQPVVAGDAAVHLTERVDALIQQAAARLAPAGVTLEVAEPITVAGPQTTPLGLTAADHSALGALQAAAGPLPPGTLTALMVPCLVETNPALATTIELAGYATRIPGGFSVGGLADAVVIAIGPCPSRNRPGELLGVVLAHELGHYLGLYHVVESTGQQDHLADTAPGAPNLMVMQPGTSSATPLTAAQIAVLRSHPMIGYDPAPPP